MMIKDFLKSIPEEFYYWIGIALFYLLSSIFKKREQRVDGVEKESSEDNSLKSFFQKSLQIDTQRDIFGNLKNQPAIEDSLDSEELTSPPSQINSTQPLVQDDKSSDIKFDNRFSSERNPTLLKVLDKPSLSGGFLKVKVKEQNKIKSLSQLGLNKTDDLKRAIIINEILSKPRAMKKNIR